MAVKAPKLGRSQVSATAKWALLAVAALALVLVKLTPLWTSADNKLFDYASTILPKAPDQPGVVFVAIDEPSFSFVDVQWPWPRIIHANLAESLRDAGAKAIAFDIVFAEGSDYEHDLALGRAVGDIGVFAADETFIETPHAAQLVRTEPIEDILAAGAKSGVASISLDGDGVIRALPARADGFARTLLEVAEGQAFDVESGKHLIQYFGPAGTYPRVSYYQAMDPERFLPEGYFNDKVVIVGYGLQAVPDIESRNVDAFETSYTLRTGQLTYGAEVHATIFDNIKHDLSILSPPRWTEFALLLLGVVAGGFVFRMSAWVHRLGIAAAGMGVVIAASWMALQYGRVWLSFLDPVMGFAAGLSVLSVRDFVLEQRMRREIQGAFSQYLSPDMVERIVADPSQLNLGGERKILTIMFADIRGFTGLSEMFEHNPQGLTQLINDILTPLANIVMENGGTIDKFIGDCIMAFWNAPLDDHDHAANAVKAASEMVAALGGINARIADQMPGKDAPPVRIGIGINTGDCVVGNMGSEARFDYSVLGDPVNVASRLEGLTKTYDTPIVIGETTRAACESRKFTQLDSIQVRGRSQELAIFKPEN